MSALAKKRMDHFQALTALENSIPHELLIDVNDLKVRHFHALGLYARELTIPAGVMVTGKIHKFEHLDIVSKGHVTCVTEEGSLDIHAPYTVVAPAGVKRAVYAHTETVWTTLHATEETDLEKIEAHFVVPTMQQYLEYVEAQKRLEV